MTPRVSVASALPEAMPSNSEMYERGAHDAVHDELNPFYYQHYYYYRRGYDDARRQASRTGGRAPALLLLLLVLAVAVAGGAWWLLGREHSPAVAVAPTVVSAAPTLAPTTRPTTTIAPTVAPTPAPPALGVGARARVVNLNGAPLRAREAAGLQARVLARIPEGSEVTLRDGPVDADGYTWWRVEAEAGTGWVAGRSPEGVVFLEVVP